MIGEQYKIKGIAQAETIHHKMDLWTFIEWSFRIKKKRYLKTLSKGRMWVDQVKFELKFTPSYLKVCSRDNASPLMRESRRYGEIFFGIKEAFHTFSLVHEKYMVSTPGHKTTEVVNPLDNQPLLINTFAVRITKHEIISIFQQSAVTG